MGDDGFGPAVIERLHTGHTLPASVWVEDVGTSIRDILFDLLLASQKPKMILIIDAARQDGRPPGELFELAVDEIAAEKVNDFSVHHFPSLNLLQELSETGGCGGAGVDGAGERACPRKFKPAFPRRWRRPFRQPATGPWPG